MSFFSELKRRNVYKVAVAYAVVAFPLSRYLSLVVNGLAFKLFPVRACPANGDRARFAIDATFNSGLDRRMKTHSSIVLFLFSFAASILAGDPKPEQALRDADDQWSKAAGAKISKRPSRFIPVTRLCCRRTAPAVTTKDGIHDMWKQIIRDMHEHQLESDAGRSREIRRSWLRHWHLRDVDQRRNRQIH